MGDQIKIIVLVIAVIGFIAYLIFNYLKARRSESKSDELAKVDLTTKVQRIAFFAVILGILIYMLF
jgi:uncharacterized membrane protein